MNLYVQVLKLLRCTVCLVTTYCILTYLSIILALNIVSYMSHPVTLSTHYIITLIVKCRIVAYFAIILIVTYLIFW